MGWVKDKGGSVVQKLAQGGKVKPGGNQVEGKRWDRFKQGAEMVGEIITREDGGKVEEYKDGGKAKKMGKARKKSGKAGRPKKKTYLEIMQEGVIKFQDVT